MINEDEYQAKILNKYLDQEEADNIEVSNCCGCEMDADDSYCPECREGCVAMSYSDYTYEERQSIAEDKADAEHEEQRDAN